MSCSGGVAQVSATVQGAGVYLYFRGTYFFRVRGLRNDASLTME